jgi:arylsulfate sulfotransferase
MAPRDTVPIALPVTLLAGLLAAAALGAACSRSSSSPPADTGDAGDAGPQPATLASLTVSSGILRPPFDPSVTDYDVTSLNSLYPIAVTATATDPGAKLTIHGASAKSGVAASFTLMPREDFTVVVAGAGLTSSTYTVHYVPSDFPPYTVTSSPGAGTEDILLTPNGEYLLLMDRSGAPLYYRTFLPNDVEDLQQAELPDGGKLYTVTVGVTNPEGWTLGVDHVMDDQFNDVTDYQLPAYAQHGVLQAEGHEFRMLGDQHYLAISYVQRTLNLSSVIPNCPSCPNWGTQALVMSNIMQEVENGNVLMEWDSANVPSLYADSYFANQISSTSMMVTDYLHLNSIDIDPSDGNFIVSFRHTSSIVKIDRTTSAILWTLGGMEDQYGLTGDQIFSFQHHVRMQPDGSVTVFDDGNNNPNMQTRVLSFVLDQVNHKVTSFNILYSKPTSQPQSGLMGSAVPLSGGRLFIGWGGWYCPPFCSNDSPNLGPAASEIVDGGTVWSLELTTPGVFSYRALPIVSP